MQLENSNFDTRKLLNWRGVQHDYGWGQTKTFSLIKSGAIESILDGGQRLIVKESCDARVARLLAEQSTEAA